jgi:hypothetical protein
MTGAYRFPVFGFEMPSNPTLISISIEYSMLRAMRKYDNFTNVADALL